MAVFEATAAGDIERVEEVLSKELRITLERKKAEIEARNRYRSAGAGGD